MIKISLLSIFFIFWFSQSTFALPIPVIAIGYDLFVFLVPIIISSFMVIVFYFKRHAFLLSIIIHLFTFSMYIFHYFVTKDIILTSYEGWIYLIVILWSIYPSMKLSAIRYIFLILWIALCFFFIKISFNLLQTLSVVHTIINNPELQGEYSYRIHDNYFQITDTSNKIQVIASNCYEWLPQAEWSLLTGYVKEKNKPELPNGKCIYGNEHNSILYKVVESALNTHSFANF